MGYRILYGYTFWIMLMPEMERTMEKHMGLHHGSSRFATAIELPRLPYWQSLAESVESVGNNISHERNSSWQMYHVVTYMVMAQRGNYN